MVSSAALGYSFTLVDKSLLLLASKVMADLGLISVLLALWPQVRSQCFLAKAASMCQSECCAWGFKHILP